MSVDIGALLVGFADEQERAAQAQAPDLVAEVVLLAARVRARRLRRLVGVIGASVVTVLLGSAVAYGLSHDAPSTTGTTTGTAPLGCSEPWTPPLA